MALVYLLSLLSPSSCPHCSPLAASAACSLLLRREVKFPHRHLTSLCTNRLVLVIVVVAADAFHYRFVVHLQSSSSCGEHKWGLYPALASLRQPLRDSFDPTCPEPAEPGQRRQREVAAGLQLRCSSSLFGHGAGVRYQFWLAHHWRF